jgi:23S rRNA (guanine745-N1)-methyltransferase
VHALVAMGPSAHHRSPESLAAAIASLPDPVAVTAAVQVTAYRPTHPGRPPALITRVDHPR